ncbi:MAG: 6-phosphogluconolactonase [Acidimicrobiales bacterium]
MLIGLRGVVNEYRSEAEQRGWVVGKIEAGGGRSLAMAAQALHLGLRSATGRYGTGERLRRALATFKAFSLRIVPDGSLALGIDVDAAAGRADTGDLELDLTELLLDLGDSAAEIGTGVLLLVDETQDLAQGELAAIAGAGHEVSQRSLPVLVVGAGLPSLPAALTAAKPYAERLLEYASIGALGADAAAMALNRPAEALGVSWEDEALDVAVRASNGYPYFLQVYGRSTWDSAVTSPITAIDARLGVEAAQRGLDVGFFGSRWERATPAQRAYLRGVAEGGDEASPTSEVARRLGRRPSDLSVARDSSWPKASSSPPTGGASPSRFRAWPNSCSASRLGRNRAMTDGAPPVGEVHVTDDVALTFASLVSMERPGAIALSGGATARRCYQALAAVPDFAWRAVRVLFGDERWVPVDSPDSNEGMARHALIDQVAPAEVHSMRQAGTTLEAAAEAYDRVVAELPAIDLVHLGLGDDGHTASLFPGTAALEVDDRLVVANGDDAHPHPRLTFTFPAVARARLAVFTVSGAGKADAWASLCRGDDLPAARVRAGRVVWLVDPAAAGR